MPNKEGMVVQDVDISTVSITVDLDLDNDEVAIGGVKADGTRILYKTIDDGTGKGLFPVVLASGGITPGTTIFTEPNTPVPAGVVPLPVSPPGTTRVTCQNVGPGGSVVIVRELGGTAGDGMQLTRYGSISFGGLGGSVAALEAEFVAGPSGPPVIAMVNEL